MIRVSGIFINNRMYNMFLKNNNLQSKFYKKEMNLRL